MKDNQIVESTTELTSATIFADLITRVREGDEAAAQLLVERYEPVIRREVRLALIDPRLSRLFDSIDVSQSVFASFFFRSSRGQFDVDCPEQLVALLLKMARNKLASRSRDAKRQKRDLRRMVSSADQSLTQLQSSDPTPSEQLERDEQIEVIKRNLTEDDLSLMESRRRGLSWTEIAQHQGGTAQACRVKLMRALKAAWAKTTGC